MIFNHPLNVSCHFWQSEFNAFWWQHSVSSFLYTYLFWNKNILLVCRPSSAAAIVSFITRKKFNDSLNRAPIYYTRDWKSKFVKLIQNAKCILLYQISIRINLILNWWLYFFATDVIIIVLRIQYFIFLIQGGFSPNHWYVEAGEHEYRLTQYLMSSYEVKRKLRKIIRAQIFHGMKYKIAFKKQP